MGEEILKGIPEYELFSRKKRSIADGKPAYSDIWI